MRRKKKYKIALCGHFGGNQKFYDGQTVKTLNIAIALKHRYGIDNIYLIDTFGGAKALIHCLSQLFLMMFRSENIIILPAQKGVKIIPSFLFLLNICFRKKIHYIVIGGWLPEMIENKKILTYILKSIDYIYVETKTMKNSLINQGFENVIVMVNFKHLKICKDVDFKYYEKPTFNLCTFSRVMKEKGIEDIINAVDYINQSNGKIIYKIDVYGKIEDKYKSDFMKLISEHTSFVDYKGIVQPHDSTKVLKDYFALIFPTRFFTEGIPGTIIDAYAAGLPVISARWESFFDLIDEGLTGFGYEINNVSDLIKILSKISDNPTLINQMKENCIKKACYFLPENALLPLIDRV